MSSSGTTGNAMRGRIPLFVERLKSRKDEVRAAAAKELTRLVNSDFRSLPPEEVAAFISEFSDHIFKMVSSPENHQKRGAMQAIMALIQVSDLASIAHYSSYIKTAQGSNDVEVIILAAKALGMLVQNYTSNAAKPYYESQVQASLDTLAALEADKEMPVNCIAPMSSVLVLKELATVNPTFFSKYLARFFETIFFPIEYAQPELRQSSVQALSAIFRIIVVREPRERQRLLYYDHCLDRVLMALADSSPSKDVAQTGKSLNRENLIHGNLLVLNELFRFSNLEWEQKMNKVEDIMKSSPVIRNKEKDTLTFRRVFKYTKRPVKQSRNLAAVTRSDATPTKESKICKSLLSERFDTICSHVVRQMHQRNVFIHKALWELLPRLAAFAPESFVNRRYLERSLQYLQQCLKREKDRGNAFLSVGMLALAVGEEHLGDPRPFVDTIIEALQTNAKFPGTGKKRQDRSVPEPAVFACISLLVRVKGPSIESDVKSLLSIILTAPLTAHLTGTLNEICQRIPSLKPAVQRDLLDVLSKCIMKRPLMHPGDPMRTQSPPETQTEPTIMVQALKTLGQFDFEDHSLLPFIKYIAKYCLGSDHAEIRLEVVRTCCLVLSPKLYLMRKSNQYSPTLMCTVQDVLSKLMSAGVTDREAEVRRCVLESLTDRFDEHLAQAEHLDALFLILNDEVFEIREQALIIIGRLSSLNPAYVMPHLRKVLVQILTELEYSGRSRNTEESAKMLAHLLSSAPKLVKPYMQPVLSVLLPKITGRSQSPQTVGVIVAVMGAIGEQAQVSGPEMSPYLEELMPIVLEMMQDHVSMEKRDMSLWTLGQLVESTGFVVVPYERYPNLLSNLLHILETESNQSMKRAVLRVLGLLGALDPFKHKLNIGAIESDVTGGVLSLSNDTGDSSYGGPGLGVGVGVPQHPSELLVAYSNNLDEFFSAMTLMSLTKMLLDQQQDSCCCAIAKSLGNLINEVGMKVVPYLPRLLPALLTVIPRKCTHTLAAKLAPIIKMTEVVGKHISAFLDEILACTRELWVVNSPMDPGVMDLMQTLVRALGSDFKVYIPRLLPHALEALANDMSPDRRVTDKLLDTMVVLGCTLEEYLHLLLPPLVRLFEQPADNEALRKKAIATTDKLADTLDISQFSSMIIHGLIRVIDSPCSTDLKDEAIHLMTMMVCQLRKKFRIFKEPVDEAIRRNRPGLTRVEVYYAMCNKVLEESSLIDDDTGIIPHQQRELREKSKEKNPSVAHKQRVGEEFIGTLTTHFDKHVLTEDWLTWLDSVQLVTLAQAPDRSVRWCSTVTTYISPIHRELFNTAFLSCWLELNKDQKERVITALQEVLTIQDVPEVTHAILNLNEFIEHYDTLLSDVNLLARKAFESRAYAKALRYREQQFQKGKSSEPEVLESLIMINNKLQQPEGAAGVLEYAKKVQGQLRVRGGWYEKLHDWNAALNSYRTARESDPDHPQPVLGQMRCLEVLAEWKQLHQLASEEWEKSSVETQAKMARMASAAAWGLQNWHDMRKYSAALPKTSLDFAFHQAVLAVHEENYHEAFQNIDRARDLLETDLSALWKESYPRAYPAMVQVQMLAELEEVIQYKLVPELKEHIKKKWWDRLQGCQASVEDWQRLLQVHSLAADPCDDQRTWLKFAALCRSSGRLQQSRRILTVLLGSSDPTPQVLLTCASSKPEVSFAFMKHMWIEARLAKDTERKKAVLNLLHKFSHEELTKIISDDGSVLQSHGMDYRRLLSKCYLKCGRWKEELEGVNEASLRDILYYLTLAKTHNPAWHKAWHAFAYINFEAILLHQRNQGRDAEVSGCYQTKDPDRGMTLQLMREYAVPAVQGFFRSIALSDGNDGSSLQDTLRLLTLWFDYGHWEPVLEALSENKKTVPVGTWLQVIPQLIARIDMPHRAVAGLIQELLMDISKHHPQALIYPLTVAYKSNATARSQAASVVLTFMSEHSANLVKQARLVSHELIRVSILWHELWHEGLEEASRLYFGERNVQGMLDTLKPLHDLMARGPETLKETAFFQAYATDLVRANECCQNYQVTHNVKDLGAAWDQYYSVFRRISKQLPQLTSLELQHCSPKLLECTNLELAVPGSYNPNQPVVKIHSVHSTLNVIASKQRPRKLCIKGSDGRDFTFLLKGHEDLRQDERVMQLFGLVNTLLINDPETSRRNLTIQRYSVIPLSTNSGLIGWVPNCDTLHTLIKDHRERKKILLNIEHRIMLRMAPQYDHLPLMQKVEVFEYALDATQGQDLAQLLWLKSPTSEEWFERRTNYTRSLAVMSMVGYILGLGDRHPSNLMLRTSGKILHIDFGDCFEVAMTREKFPEKIPFRLTRMLILAMEVTGIEGTYRITCEKVLKVLRNHKDSLMAVLEAFVYDPLFNWRLVDANVQPTGRSKHPTAARPVDTTVAREPAPQGAAIPNATNCANNHNNKNSTAWDGQQQQQHQATVCAPGPDAAVQQQQTEALATGPTGDASVRKSSANETSKPSDLSQPPSEAPNDESARANPQGEPAIRPQQQQQPPQGPKQEVLNRKAVAIIKRVREKLTGCDFDQRTPLEVSQQVELLIRQATSPENLCQCYIGWCPFW